MNAVAEPAENEDRTEAYKEAAVELGKGIALGFVPILGQLIDAYDTLEAIQHMSEAKNPEDKENAQFDFILALVGWVPGPGDGVKKTLRIVNKDPARFAPVLFDLLRFVLQECGIQTSPETLLEEIFNAGKLTGVLEEAKKGVEDFSGFKSLPAELQSIVLAAFDQAANNLPAMVGIVEKRLRKWKKVQRNSSANAPARNDKKDGQKLPEAKKGETSQDGHNRNQQVRNDSSNNSVLATLAPNELNELLGICGEHIADYYCLETFGWGSGWQKHDDGEGGDWTEAKPGKDTPGKLSRNGKLFRLDSGPNGTGLDAVWRAGGSNGGKPYAIVEAKSSKQEDAPKFNRKPLKNLLGDNSRTAKKRKLKDKVQSKIADQIVTDPVELIEPLQEDETGVANKDRRNNKNKKTKVKSDKAKTTKPTNRDKQNTDKDKTKNESDQQSGNPGLGLFVQMSKEWIDKNLVMAVGFIAGDIKRKGYSRHLFFSPMYHTSLDGETQSPAQHKLAKEMGKPPSDHAKHDAFHYNETEVKAFVNKRKAKLRKEFKNHPNLQDEK